MWKSRYITQLSDLPTGEHWTIITQGSYWDESTQTSVSHLKYQVFTDKAEFEAEYKSQLKSNGYDTKKVVGTHVNVYGVTIQTEIMLEGAQ